MLAHSSSERRAWAGTTAAVIAVIAVANVMSNRVLPEAWYVPWNVAVAVAIVLLARRCASWAEMGFGSWRRGLAFGLTLFVLTAGVLLLAVAMPAFNELYHDRRVTTGWWSLIYQAGLRIPLGTALLEEAAFRGVLPALFALRWGVLRGCILASALFGLWHVLPALGLNHINPTATQLFGNGAGGVAAAVVFAVIGTLLAGLWWCWVRYRARSVLATVLAHIGSNSVAYAIAWTVTRK